MEVSASMRGSELGAGLQIGQASGAFSASYCWLLDGATLE
jgi:hypothetical protein